MKLIPLPAFQDNYVWLLHDGQRALVVDPGDAAPVQAHLAEHGLRLTAILVTHHHPDHVGGVDVLREATGAARILYGGSVTPDNAASLLAVDGVDGALVGGASIDSSKFQAILDAAGRPGSP